ncbi:MAG: hypothetical protein ACXW18_09925 [Pyrinomonadaceae bacterium]
MSKDIQYITKSDGERIAVIISLEEYENILQTLNMAAADFESSGDSRPLSTVLEEMRAAGEIDI